MSGVGVQTWRRRADLPTSANPNMPPQLSTAPLSASASEQTGSVNDEAPGCLLNDGLLSLPPDVRASIFRQLRPRDIKSLRLVGNREIRQEASGQVASLELQEDVQRRIPELQTFARQLTGLRSLSVGLNEG